MTPRQWAETLKAASEYSREPMALDLPKGKGRPVGIKNGEGSRRTTAHRWIDDTTRFAYYLRAGWTCTYCGRDLKPLPWKSITLDHIVPVANDGRNGDGNVAVVCMTCNSSKNDQALARWVLSQIAAGNVRLRSLPAIQGELESQAARDLKAYRIKADILLNIRKNGGWDELTTPSGRTIKTLFLNTPEALLAIAENLADD